jgi:diaminopimelate decarboxylase
MLVGVDEHSHRARMLRTVGMEPKVRPGADEAAALLRRFGSPLYVYDAAEVERAYRAFIAAFPYDCTESHYAVVCNKNPHLLRRLRELGAGVHANTPGDAFAALQAGFPPERIVYSGTNLSRADLLYLLEHGIRMNLDSLDQLRDYACLAPGTPVGLRLLVEDPSGHPTGSA